MVVASDAEESNVLSQLVLGQEMERETYVTDGVGLGVYGKVVVADCAWLTRCGCGAVDDLFWGGNDVVEGSELLWATLGALSFPVIPCWGSGGKSNQACDDD